LRTERERFADGISTVGVVRSTVYNAVLDVSI
jgi:hypothetical protein